MEELVHRGEGGHVPEHQLLLLAAQDVQVDQGVGVRLPHELEVLHQVVLPVEHLVDGLLQLELLGAELVDNPAEDLAPVTGGAALARGWGWGEGRLEKVR